MTKAKKQKNHGVAVSELLDNLATVLIAADKGSHVLETKIPSEFYENEPTLIGTTFLEYIQDKDDFPTTSVLDKFVSKDYKSIYQLYHDIRLSAFILLHQLDIGSDSYLDIDRFYKFSTEFIMRESFNLNIELSEKNQLTSTEEISDFDTMLSQDFVKISTTYTLGNQDVFYLISQSNIPLFSSLNQRSALDQREINTSVRFETSKVLPHTYTPSQNTLSSISPVSNRIAQLSEQQPQQILSTFLHPNWYSLPTAKWLEQSDFQSFAPVVDEQNIVVSSSDKARLWLEHVGYAKLLDSLEKTEKKVEEGIEDKAVEVKDGEEKDVEMNGDEETVGQISLEDLYEWTPGNEIDEDEIEAFEDGTESELINKSLAKLQALQNARLLKGLTKPSVEETKIYHKVNRLLIELISASDRIPKIPHSSSIPILQTEYSGTLPVATQAFAKKSKNKARR